MKPPVAGSVAHQHVAAVLNSLLPVVPRASATLRILDVGVGDGRFLQYLMDVLPCWHPGLALEVHGLDVDRWTVFEKRGLPRLQAARPDIDWRQRVAFIPVDAEWPFPAGSFHFITSNQVLEHVVDKPFFLGQVRRCLAPGGISINVFPVREVLWEGHAHMPFVHWFEDPWRRRLLRLFTTLGFRHAFHARLDRWPDIPAFASGYSGVLGRNTAYCGMGTFAALARAAGLAPRFTYTKDYYAAKLLSFAGVRPRRYRDCGMLDHLLALPLRHVASITVLLRHAGSPSA